MNATFLGSSSSESSDFSFFGLGSFVFVCKSVERDTGARKVDPLELFGSSSEDSSDCFGYFFEHFTPLGPGSGDEYRKDPQLLRFRVSTLLLDAGEELDDVDGDGEGDDEAEDTEIV